MVLLAFSLDRMQAYLYSARFRHDPKIIKLLVAFIFVIDVAESANLISLMWDYLIKNFGDFANTNVASSK